MKRQHKAHTPSADALLRLSSTLEAWLPRPLLEALMRLCRSAGGPC